MKKIKINENNDLMFRESMEVNRKNEKDKEKDKKKDETNEEILEYFVD